MTIKKFKENLVTAKKKKFSTENETPENQKSLGMKKSFSVKDLISFKPMTDRQKDFFEAFYSNIPVIVQDGPAGTGKSIVSIYCALSKVFSYDSDYEKLIIVRSAVEARSQGFLPGTKEEKDAAFETPYADIMGKITNYNSTYAMLKMLGKCEFMTTAHLRGVTFDNTIVIVDEAQNADIEELATIFTRLGQNSMMIVCGDTAQNDLFRKREKSGFDDFKLILKNMPSELSTTITYNFNDIVRSRLVKEFIISRSNLGI